MRARKKEGQLKEKGTQKVTNREREKKGEREREEREIYKSKF